MNVHTKNGNTPVKVVSMLQHEYTIILFDANVCAYTGGLPPQDSDIVEISWIEISSSLFYVVTLLAVLGVLYCIICVLFNLRFKNTR